MALLTGILILGDQLTWNNPALKSADPENHLIIMAEVNEEATYVRHNRHKIALLFSAMRHFADELRQNGYRVSYYKLGDSITSLVEACRLTCERWPIKQILLCEPGEYRLIKEIAGWSDSLGIDVKLEEDTRFLASRSDFAKWAQGRKQLRMEYFYREMRKRYGILMDSDQPAGGKWNFDAENRVGWRNQVEIPERLMPKKDEITEQVINEVLESFPTHPGDLCGFRWSVTRESALIELEWFCENILVNFGTYQDSLSEDSPWLFHGLISMYLNIGLLEPLEVCQRVEGAFRMGECSIAAAEGFIRQILGWREYVRGIYWYHMPEYKLRNTLDANLSLPTWFWTGETNMRCLSSAIRQSLDHGYAHHIQRLMVIGNFSLIAGLDVRAVCDWYLGVYVDAYEWVELPNTLGMALFADGGIMASKPYAASGKYIQKQGDHCKGCKYDPKRVIGEGACPYNSLYWHFIDRHQDTLSQNARMGLILGGWKKRDQENQEAVLRCAAQYLEEIENL